MTSVAIIGDCEIVAEVTGPGTAEVSVAGRDARPTVEVAATGLAVDSVLRVKWSLPNRDGVGLWTARTDAERWLPVSFSEPWKVSALTSSPIGALYSADDRNRLTFALSETLAVFQLQAGVSGATARFFGVATFDASAWLSSREYSVKLSLDTADVPISQSIETAMDWWAGVLPPGLEAPAAARVAMYSTWYSLGQSFDGESIEREARLAVEVGCGSMIVDDGWQTSDRVGGYASCGDWEPDPVAFPDMAAHVARVQSLGLRYLLWFAPPFMGSKSAAFQRFESKMLGYRPDLDTWVLDPRYPDVRAHMVDRVVRAVRLWGIDGVKIDFIDAFALAAPPAAPGTDVASVERAVVQLLDQLTRELKTLRPDIMIEFRQTYVGPRLRSFANMMRVTDCAMDSTENRVHSLDLRLIAGQTVVHSDMVMWHSDATPQVAARQLLDVLFSVPQVSMSLAELSSDHRAMLSFWLSIFAQYRAVLLNGRLLPSRPDLSYPSVRVDDAAVTIVALYDAAFYSLDDAPSQTVVLVNGTIRDRLVICASSDLGDYDLLVRDCTGVEFARGTVTLSKDPCVIYVPPSGIAVLVHQSAF